jgi:hypothetical protein
MGFLAVSTLPFWISMCYLTTAASTLKRATVAPVTRRLLSGRKALTIPV